MDIGKPQRVIEVEPEIPVPAPPEPAPTPQPAEAPALEPLGHSDDISYEPA